MHFFSSKNFDLKKNIKKWFWSKKTVNLIGTGQILMISIVEKENLSRMRKKRVVILSGIGLRERFYKKSTR